MKRIIVWIAAIVVMTPALGFVSNTTNVYQYNASDAASVVKAIHQMMLATDFEAMLAITAGSEKQKTQDLIDSLHETPALINDLKKAVKNIVNFEISRTDYFTNQNTIYAIVSTRWTLKVDASADAGARLILPPAGGSQPLDFSIIQVDYLLQLFDNKWKIISMRSK